MSEGRLHSHFDPERKQLEDIGRNAAIRLFRNYYKCSVIDNDVLNGDRQYTKPDLLAIFPNKNKLQVEAAGKNYDVWHHIKSGVDVECRKLKYTRHGWMIVCMAKSFFDEPDFPPNELLLIPGTCLVAASESCGDTFAGMGKIVAHPDFKMPEHGCHRVRKNCKTKTGWEVNDFFRIPYKYVTHIRCDDGVYSTTQRWENFKWPK